jgi:hypothetical protein
VGRLTTASIHRTVAPIIPCANAQLLTERLPDARGERIPGVGQVPMTEQPHGVAAIVQAFCGAGTP